MPYKWYQYRTTSELASILKISMVHTLRTKGEKILNTLVDNYNRSTIKDKSLVRENTSNLSTEG